MNKEILELSQWLHEKGFKCDWWTNQDEGGNFILDLNRWHEEQTPYFTLNRALELLPREIKVKGFYYDLLIQGDWLSYTRIIRDDHEYQTIHEDLYSESIDNNHHLAALRLLKKTIEEGYASNNEQKYTDLTQSQRLKEIGFEAEADGYWNMDGSLLKIGKLECKPLYYSNWTPAFRLDTLMLELPEWWNKFKLVGVEFYAHTQDYLEAWVEKKAYSEDFLKTLYGSICYKGQQQIAACVDLICLLKEVNDV